MKICSISDEVCEMRCARFSSVEWMLMKALEYGMKEGFW